MAKNWIKGATANKGGLHRSLGIPEGQKIPASRIAAAAKEDGRVGAEARLAQTLEGLRPKAHHQVHGSSDARSASKKTVYKA